MNSPQRTNVFCDWLDFTVPAEKHTLESLAYAFCDFGISQNCEGVLRTPSGKGVLKITKYGSVYRVSISGGMLTFFRNQGYYTDLILWMSETPHHITRFDAALDVFTPAPSVLRSLTRKYKAKGVKLGQRALPVTTMFSYNDSEELTGTFYAGHRTRADVTARVYDKQFEASQKSGDILPPTTRYEITVRGDRSKKSPCLRDLHDPTSIFYQFASPAFLKVPGGVSPWEPVNEFTFKPSVADTKTAYEMASRLIDESGLLETLARHAASMGPYGVSSVVRMVEKKIGSSMPEDSPVQRTPSPHVSEQPAPLA